MGSVNKQFGFYGTVNNEFDDETTERIWNLMMTKLKEMYPNKQEDELVEFLDSRVGRHFADDLLSDPKGITMGVLMLKIAMLNKLKMAPWWGYYNGITPAVAVLDKSVLFRSAIKHEMRKKEIRELVATVVGCGMDKVWQTPEMWLDSENTTTQEMHLMWGYIQDKLNKRTKHGNNKQPAGKAAAC